MAHLLVVATRKARPPRPGDGAAAETGQGDPLGPAALPAEGLRRPVGLLLIGDRRSASCTRTLLARWIAKGAVFGPERQRARRGPIGHDVHLHSHEHGIDKVTQVHGESAIYHVAPQQRLPETRVPPRSASGTSMPVRHTAPGSGSQGLMSVDPKRKQNGQRRYPRHASVPSDPHCRERQPSSPGRTRLPPTSGVREKRMWPARSTGTSSTVSRIHPPPRPRLP